MRRKSGRWEVGGCNIPKDDELLWPSKLRWSRRLLSVLRRAVCLSVLADCSTQLPSAEWVVEKFSVATWIIKSISFCTLILLCVLVHWMNTIANVTACLLDCLVTPLVQLLYSGVSFFSGKWCLPSNPWVTWRHVYVHHICVAVRGKTYLAGGSCDFSQLQPDGARSNWDYTTLHCTPLVRDNMLEIRQPWAIWHVSSRVTDKEGFGMSRPVSFEGICGS